ncbi:MAG: aldehyde ferredoxin oxidoreductase family protein [Sedimentibacter sp.]|uniref:aldehyde ferredoxin oxidoreductase family protein n=1 Tax=Sedimentibacter sp. TaxID=1960295 RepID=UPI003159515D
MIGKFLEIDLTKETTREFYLHRSLYKKYIGGKGIGAYLLFRYLKPGTDGLSPENPLIFLTGPLTGTGFPTSGRMVVVSKSPLTNTFADSHAGGHFSYEMKRAGYDGIVVLGKASEHMYLWIQDGKVEFRDAGRIWGETVSCAVEKLRLETQISARVACIGPAGENLSLISAVMLDKDSDKTRAGIAGRTGLGAVMGSKNLKAVVIKGSNILDFENPDLFKEGRDGTRKVIEVTEFMKVRSMYGSANLVGPMNESGFLPTNNFQSGYIENGEDLYCENMNRHKKRNATCYGCPISCGQIVGTKKGEDVKIEYESIALLGSNNGIRNFSDVAEACHLCNELGLDSMSAGVTAGFAMECREKGLLSNVPVFGDSLGQLELLRNMAYRKDEGALLADGVKKASEKIGNGSHKFAIHVKGLEMAGYEPRTSWGMALAYATSDRGACHQRCWTVNAERSGILKMFSFDDKSRFIIDGQNERAAAFSALVCDFLPFELKDLCSAFQGVTGLEFSEKDYYEAGERIWNLIRLFNVREGFSRKDDTLPDRMFEEKANLPKGVYSIDEASLNREDFQRALSSYYEERGWDEQGYPTEEKLEELDLSDFIRGDEACSYLKKLYGEKRLSAYSTL